MELLIKIDIFLNESCSLDFDVLPHSFKVCVDVVAQMNATRNPWKGITTQLNHSRVSLFEQKSHKFGFALFRVNIGTEFQVMF